MAKVLLDYTVLDQNYQNGLFCFFQGAQGTPTNVALPIDTQNVGLSPSPIQPTASDPVLFSYMNGDKPRALLCIVTTSGGTSTGLYFVAEPYYPASSSNVAWRLIAGGTTGITLVVGRTPVAGNPYGVVYDAANLYIVDYDTTNVYTVSIADLENATSGGNVPAAAYAVPSAMLPSGTDVVPHGGGLISLVDNSGASPVAYLYALFNGAVQSGTYPTGWVNSTVVRLTTAGGLNAVDFVTVGINAQGLVPAFTPQGSGYILVPAIGGIQQAGTTNGTNSTLYSVSPFGTSLAASVALTGDAAAAVAANVNFDIKSLAVSDDGIAYLLVATNDANYNTWWRLFKATVADILAAGGKTLDNGINAGILTQVDAGYGSPEYYWEILYENSSTPGNGRLWFVRGTPIRVSVGSDYDTEVLFDTGVLYAGSSIYPTGVNVNSADLIGEMIYQYNKGASIDTRLIKGREAAKATAAAAAKAASAEEEEK